MDYEIRKAEKAAYSKGYTAGRRRTVRAISDKQRATKENALWQSLFIAALPVAMSITGWSRRNQPITTLEDRTKLATDFANEALRQAKIAGRT